MKNRKIILTTVLLVILSVTLLSFTACNKDNAININELAANAPQTYNTQSESRSLDALSSYANTDICDNHIYVSGTSEDGKYKYAIYSIPANKILVEGVADDSTNVIRNYMNGVFMLSVTNPAELTTRTVFYDVYGEIISFDKSVTISSGDEYTDFSYVTLSDNSTISLDKTGKGKYIPFSPDPQLKDMSVAGDYLLYNLSGDNYLVYDKELNFVCSYSESEVFTIGSGYSRVREIAQGNKLLSIYRERVTDDKDTDYDYMDDSGNRYRLYQYLLDVSTGKASLIADKFLITKVVDNSITEDYFFAYYSDISDKALSSIVSLGLFDKNFNLVANVSEIVGYDAGSVTSIDKVGDYVVFSSAIYFTFVKDNQVAFKLAASYGSTVEYSRFFYGNYVYFDTFTGKTVTDIPGNAVLQGTDRETNGLIYYKVSEEIDNEGVLSYVYRTYVYDVNSGVTTLIDDSDNVTFYSYVYTVRDPESGMLSMYDTFSNKTVFSNKKYTTMQYNYIPDGTVVTCKAEDGTVDRYIVKLS